MVKVAEVTQTKAFMSGPGAPCSREGRLLSRDWSLTTRMGFAVNKSQLVQSEGEETAQKGRFVTPDVCQPAATAKQLSALFFIF